MQLVRPPVTYQPTAPAASSYAIADLSDDAQHILRNVQHTGFKFRFLAADSQLA